MKKNISEEMSLLEALAFLYPDSSKATLRSWLKLGRVTVEGKTEKLATFSVKKGQEVGVQPKQQTLDRGVKILYEDNHMVVVNKPAGLLSVATDLEKEHTVHAVLKEKYRPKKVYVVHRLDQGTSGVMVFALSEKAYIRFKEIFEKHEVERAYSAVVEGHLEESSGTWRSYLYEDGNYVVHTTEDKKKGRLAVTHYEVENVSKRYSRLRLKLETGRKNQIRVQCKAAGHPVVGDKKYRAETNTIFRLCLHAYLLAFKHPVTEKNMRFESPIPERFFQLVRRI